MLSKGRIQNKLHLDGERAGKIRRALLSAGDGSDRRKVGAALAVANEVLKGAGVEAFGVLHYVRRDLSTRATLLFDLDRRVWLIECFLLAALSVTHRFRRALKRAASEAFESEVVQTQMLELTIGEGQEFANREEWIQHRIEGWMRK